MPRSYRHIQQYEKEMAELKEEGMTVKEIGAKFGLTKYIDFYNNQRIQLKAKLTPYELQSQFVA